MLVYKSTSYHEVIFCSFSDPLGGLSREKVKRANKVVTITNILEVNELPLYSIR